MPVIDPVTLTQALVRRPSVTPLDEGAQQVLIDALTSLGFKIEKLKFGIIENFFARLGTGGPHLCFAGHTDVVPTGDEAQWKHPPFSATVENGILYGRGTADMKANIAAFAAAVSSYIEAHGQLKGSISFLITGDEEGHAIDGTIKVLEWMQKNGQVPDACIVGEPSNPKALGDEIKIGRRGSFNGRLTVKGAQGHVAYPNLADNPLPRLVKMLDALTAYKFDEGSEFFPATNLEVTSIDVGNKADNVIPERGIAKFNIRFCDKWTSKTLEKKVREILNAVYPDYELEVACNAESFITDPGKLIDVARGAVEDITGRTPALTTGGGTSDARFISRYCPVVEFGLINATIHKTDEHVKVSDLQDLTRIYRRMIERFFEGDAA